MLLKSRLPLQFVQWKFFVPAPENNQTVPERHNGGRSADTHSAAHVMTFSSGGGRMRIRRSSTSTSGKIVVCEDLLFFLRTVVIMSHSLNT